jgi:hypothetical protein
MSPKLSDKYMICIPVSSSKAIRQIHYMYFLCLHPKLSDKYIICISCVIIQSYPTNTLYPFPVSSSKAIRQIHYMYFLCLHPKLSDKYIISISRVFIQSYPTNTLYVFPVSSSKSHVPVSFIYLVPINPSSKGKVPPHATKKQGGGVVQVWVQLSLTSALDGGELAVSRSGSFIPGKSVPAAHRVRDGGTRDTFRTFCRKEKSLPQARIWTPDRSVRSLKTAS